MSSAAVGRADLHHVITVHAGATTSSQLKADCPRRRESVDAEECAACPHLQTVVGGGPGREHLLCVTEQAEEPSDAMPRTVRKYMTRDVWCVTGHVTFETLLILLRDRHFRGLPVVDTNGHLCGIVSLRDLVNASRPASDSLDSFDVTLAERGGRASPLTAADVMSTDALAFHENDSIETAARRLADRGVHGAPVVSHTGRVIGMLTSFDLLRALAEPRRELED